MTDRSLERTRDSIMDDFSQVLSEADSLLKQSARETGEKASALREQVEAKLLTAKKHALELQEDAMKKAKAAAQFTDEYVHDNPWQAVGVGVVVGFLVGVLVSRR